MSVIQRHLSGMALCLGIAATALLLGRIGWLQQHAIGALTLAILLGILLGNTWHASMAGNAGVLFTKHRLLQLGIILYGFRLTFLDIAQVGWHGALIDALVLGSTFMLAWLFGRRLFDLDRNTVILIGAGSSICGAAAVMATEPVVRGKDGQVSVAVSTVLVFGTLSMLLYPALFQWNMRWHLLPASSQAFGMFTGSTVHEVAQVVAAASPLGSEATNTAVIAKMVRVMMLAPFLLLLSVYLTASKTAEIADGTESKRATRISIPWFALVFILVAGLNTLAVLPQSVVHAAIALDDLLLAMAMAALGLCTHISAVRKAGLKPLLLGALLFSWLIVGGALINRWLGT